MSLWESMVNRWYKKLHPEEFETPEIYGKVAGWEVGRDMKPYLDDPNDFFVSDSKYNTTSKSEAWKFCEKTRVEALEYQSEGQDCDDFSVALYGYWARGLENFPFGIAWSRKHAFNIMYDNEKKIWIIEPQSNTWHRIEDIEEDNDMYYPSRLILI